MASPPPIALSSRAVAAILIAADAFAFLFAWEILTVSFYVLAGVNRASVDGTHTPRGSRS